MILEETSLENYLKYSSNNKRVLIYKVYDWRFYSPFDVYRNIEAREDSVHYMEIGDSEVKVGRYAYICFKPQVVFSSFGTQSILGIRDILKVMPGDPYENLKKIVDTWRCPNCQTLPTLIGGGIGFLGYNVTTLFENIPDRHPNLTDIPDIFFQFHERMVLFDNLKGQVIIGIAVIPTQNKQADYLIAQEKIQNTLNYLLPIEQVKKSDVPPVIPTFEPDVSDDQYCEIVNKAKEYIKAGDAFQIVLSRTFEGKTNAHSCDIFEALRETNPSPCMFILKTNDFIMLGCSPERLLSCYNRNLETWPIAGSRPRGQDKDDETLSKELLSDEKELAEHMMLVDLSRNDLGAVSKIGSVRVPELTVIHHYSHIMHIVSKVVGTLKDELHPLDALKAAFPAGTLSGAPKIRAMQIIDELEKSRRGNYGGVILFVDGKGDMDSFINIRSMLLKDDKVYVRAGAGVVFDSIPINEANETRHKAMAPMKVFSILEAENL